MDLVGVTGEVRSHPQDLVEAWSQGHEGWKDCRGTRKLEPVVVHLGQVDDGIGVGACSWILDHHVTGINQRCDADVLEGTEGADGSRAGRVRVVPQHLPCSSMHL